jgi:anaerobic selenocysteine-containing dehydrogenase
MRDLISRFTQAMGSPNAVSHDSLNIEAAKLAHLLTQGIYDLMAYDLENTNHVLSFGASLLEAGRPAQRFLSGYAYIRRGRPKRGKVVVVDPRLGVSGAWWSWTRGLALVAPRPTSGSPFGLAPMPLWPWAWPT